MVIAGKAFRVVETISIGSIAEKLSGYKSEQPVEGSDLTLLTEIRDLITQQDELSGTISRDVPVRLHKRGELEVTFKTVDIPFLFKQRNTGMLLFVAERKPVANATANMFSSILFLSLGGVLNAEIPPKALESYHRKNPQGTKVMFFDGLEIPNLDKISLYGPSISDTPLYPTYVSQGSIWYVVVTSSRYGYVVGITRDGVVTVFNTISVEDFLRFAKDEVFELIGQPGRQTEPNE